MKKCKKNLIFNVAGCHLGSCWSVAGCHLGSCWTVAGCHLGSCILFKADSFDFEMIFSVVLFFLAVNVITWLRFRFSSYFCKGRNDLRTDITETCLGSLYLQQGKGIQKKTQKYVLLIQVGINKKLRIGQLVLSQNEQMDGNQGSISPTLYMQLLHMQIPKE